MMDFEKIKETMTKEEFLNNHNLTHLSGCPQGHGLKNEKGRPCFGRECRDCWKEAIESNNVKFKGDKAEEQKVIEALKIVKDYCKSKDCTGCKFGEDKECNCIICEGLSSFSPVSWDIKLIESTIKPKVSIYEVVHKEEGKHYLFISDEQLFLWDMVVCDTSQGKRYGRIVGIRKGIDEGYKKCWKVR